jgi:hypothetical protein
MDQATKIIEGVGEVGVDTTASPGVNGTYYVRHYATGYDAVGFESEEEALAELDYIQNADSIDDSFPLSLEYDDDGYEGELL